MRQRLIDIHHPRAEILKLKALLLPERLARQARRYFAGIDGQRLAIAQPIAANMAGVEQSTVIDGGGIVEYCRLNGITIQAWSPFQAGFFTGVFLENPAYPELNAAIERMAAEHGVTPLGIATAWITRHPADMQVVLGTTTPERVTWAAAGADVELTRPEWYELYRAAGYLVP